MVDPALVSTVLTSETSVMVRLCRSSSEPVPVENAPVMTASALRSLLRPGWTARSNDGNWKSSTSATRRSVVLAPERGGASTVAHCTTAEPSSVLLRTPLVPVAPSGDPGVMSSARTPSSFVDAAIVSGAPTSAVSVRVWPAASYSMAWGLTVRFSSVRSISTGPV